MTGTWPDGVGDDGAGMPTLTIYLHGDCHLCEQALLILRPLASEYGAPLVECDINDDESLLRAYFERVPVIALDDEELCEFVADERLLRARLEEAGGLPGGGEHPLESAR